MIALVYVAFGFLLGVIFAKWRFQSQRRAQKSAQDKFSKKF